MGTHSKATPEVTSKRVALTERHLAQRWDTTVGALQQMRRRGTSPAWFTIGLRSVRYWLDVIEDYERRLFRSVGEFQAERVDTKLLEQQRASLARAKATQAKARPGRLRHRVEKLAAERQTKGEAQP